MKIEAPTTTDTGRKSPIPHERRRHPRRLSAEGGHFKETRIAIIPAVWIGESEKVVGNKRFDILPRLKLLGFWYQQALLDFSSLTCPTPLVDAPTSSLKIL